MIVDYVKLVFAPLPTPQLHEARLEFEVDLGEVLPALVDHLLGRQRRPQLRGHDGRGSRLFRLQMEHSVEIP